MAEYKIVKASSDGIKQVKIKKTGSSNIKGKDWFPSKYPNMFLLAKKHSGKSTVIANIIDKCAGEDTKFIFIVSTIHKDPIWKAILKLLDSDNVTEFTSIIDNDGVNIIEQFINDHANDGEEDEDSWEHNYPEYIIVMDDLGKSMRNKHVEQLLKTNRHYHAMVIMSSQNLNDLPPASISQLDYILVFARLPIDKLEELHDKLLLSIDFDTFRDLYEKATEEPYSFFYISRASSEDEFRIGFVQKFEIPGLN